MKIIRVQYFAALREQRGLSSEDLSTSAATPEELYIGLAGTYSFGLKPEQVRQAVNGSFVSPDHALSDGDSVVFIPPVAGG